MISVFCLFLVGIRQQVLCTLTCLAAGVDIIVRAVNRGLLFAEGVCAVPSHNGAITVSSNHNSCSVTTYVNSAASDATDVTGRHLSDIKPSLPL